MIKFENYINLNGKYDNKDNFKKLEKLLSFMDTSNITELSSPEEIIRMLKRGKKIEEDALSLIKFLSESSQNIEDEKYWMKTDPNNPPFKIGQKVWIKSTMSSSLDFDESHLLKDPQIISEMMPIPCSDINLWEIKLKGCDVIFTSEDIEDFD